MSTLADDVIPLQPRVYSKVRLYDCTRFTTTINLTLDLWSCRRGDAVISISLVGLVTSDGQGHLKVVLKDSLWCLVTSMNYFATLL